MDDDAPLLHLTRTSAWSAAQEDGVYAIPAGAPFVHLCQPDQLASVVARLHPPPHGDVIVLTVDPEDLPIVVEAASDGAGHFPHLYAPLPVDAVTDVRPLGDVLRTLS